MVSFFFLSFLTGVTSNLRSQQGPTGFTPRPIKNGGSAVPSEPANQGPRVKRLRLLGGGGSVVTQQVCRFLSGEHEEPLCSLLLFVLQRAPPLLTEPSTLSCFDWSAAWPGPPQDRHQSIGTQLPGVTAVGVACWSDTPTWGCGLLLGHAHHLLLLRLHEPVWLVFGSPVFSAVLSAAFPACTCVGAWPARRHLLS